MTIINGLRKQQLLSLKLKDLKLVALSIGTPYSGTKDTLASRIWEAVHKPLESANSPKSHASLPAASHHRNERKILSIDMGIKNFAYCRLRLPDARIFPHQDSRTSASQMPRELWPKLHEWNRMNLLASAESNSTADGFSESGKDLFHPKKLAEYAYGIVERLVLHPARTGDPPDIILIERQRFRTMGSSVVQEWTLRVNMLEAMLWAILQTERERGTWHGTTYAVSPSLVAGWWQAREAATGAANPLPSEGAKSAKLSGKQKKAIRVDRAAQCLQNGVEIVDPAAQETYDAYLRRMLRGKGRQVLGEDIDGDSLRKLDDLADCLLQALAWISWERSRRILLEGGAMGLADVQVRFESLLPSATDLKDPP